jgi:hypothetical protein
LPCIGVFKGKENAGARHMVDQLVARQKLFTTEDILWTLGIWSVTIGLSPVIAFYMLMVA